MPALGLAVYVPELGEHLPGPTLDEDHSRSVLRGLDEFREHLGGTLTILMLRSIGAPFDVHEIRRDVMIRSIGVLRDFEQAHRARHAPADPADPADDEGEEPHGRHHSSGIPARSEGTGR